MKKKDFEIRVIEMADKHRKQITKKSKVSKDKLAKFEDNKILLDVLDLYVKTSVSHSEKKVEILKDSIEEEHLDILVFNALLELGGVD